MSYQTVQNTNLIPLEQCSNIAVAKAQDSPTAQAILGLMAGGYVAVVGIFSLTFASAFIPLGISSALVRVMIGLVFPSALFIIVFTGSNLFTGNCCYVTLALMDRRITVKQSAKILLISYFTNFFAAVAMSWILFIKTDLIQDPTLKAFTISMAEKKIHNLWHENFLRGIGCNWMVCMGVQFSMKGQTMWDKMAAMWWPIFCFVVCGFEHCVANMFFIPSAIMVDSERVPVDLFITKNLIPVTLGNILGGAIFAAIIPWFSNFFHVDKRHLTFATLKGLAHMRLHHAHHDDDHDHDHDHPVHNRELTVIPGGASVVLPSAKLDSIV